MNPLLADALRTDLYLAISPELERPEACESRFHGSHPSHDDGPARYLVAHACGCKPTLACEKIVQWVVSQDRYVFCGRCDTETTMSTIIPID